jgi:multidrug efflux system membrane fusion protein
LLDTHKDVTTMSTAGIQRGAPGTFVYLVNADSTVSVRPVKLGVTDGDHVEILSGLAPGDRIVIDGADKLRDGAKIVIRSETTPAQTTNPAQTPDKSGGGKKRRSDGEQKQ